MRPSLNLDSFEDLFVQRQRRFIIIVVVAAMISLRSSPFRGSKNASFVLSSRLLEGSQGRERVPSSDLGGQVISISLSLSPADKEQSECCVQSRMQLAYGESEAIHFFDESLVLLLLLFLLL